MWWLLPWLLFLACVAAIAVAYLRWRHRSADDHPGRLVSRHDMTEVR
jgi:hypothetical protein